MEDLIKLQQKLVPELLELLEKRYKILSMILYNQPIGRRTLASKLELSERVVRSEVEFLNFQSLINVKTSGMEVTEEGERILIKLRNFIHSQSNFSELQLEVKSILGIKEIYIVPGDARKNQNVMDEIGRAAGEFLIDKLKDHYTIALTGGSTLKSVVDNTPKTSIVKDVVVLPARGGMGGSVEYQANMLVANLAAKIQGSYKLLYVPDDLDNDFVLDQIKNERSIKEVLEALEDMDILLCGIGRADKMARRRGLSKSKIDEILEKGAVGEAFGAYFNSEGEVVFRTNTLGLKSENIKDIKDIIAIAGEKSKASAIIATLKGRRNASLITDEVTAKEILYIMKQINK